MEYYNFFSISHRPSSLLFFKRIFDGVATKFSTSKTSVSIVLIMLLLSPTGLIAQTISWTGGGDGTSWNQESNWDQNRIPESNDDVAITLNGTYTVQQTGSIEINSLTLGGTSGTQRLVKTTSNFVINTESSIGENGVLRLSGGYITGEGTLINNGIIVSDAAGWSGLNGFDLVNEGVIEQRNGIFYVTGGSTLENNGLYDIQGDINIVQSGAASLFINNSRFLKSSAGEGHTSVTTPFDSRPGSTIESAAGELRLQGPSLYHNTTFVADDSDASIRLFIATHTFRGTITGAPAGQVILNASAEAHEEGATFNFEGTGLTWVSSYMMGGGTFTNEGLIRLDANSWTGVNGSTLINEGTIEQLRGIFYVTGGSTLENNGLYDIQGDINIVQSGAASLFINNSRFLKSSAGEGHTSVTTPFDSRPGSTIESAAGELRLQGPSLYHNTTFVADDSDASIRLFIATHTFRGTITGAPAGQVILNASAEAHEEGATFNFEGTGLTWVSSYMMGGGTFTNEGLIRLDANSWTGVNGSTLINEGTIEQLRGIFYVTSGSTLENNGLYDIQGDNNIFQSGAASLFINNSLILKSVTDEGLTSVTVPIESRSESTIESSDGAIRFQGKSSYHNTTFIASSENAEIRFLTSEHTFRGNISGDPIGQIVINTNIRADTEDGATWNFGGNGITWVSSYLQSGGILTNTGLVTLDATSWTGLNNSMLINDGDIIQENGIFYLSGGAMFENNSMFNAKGGSGILRSGAESTFKNNDQLILESINTPYTISTAIENSSSATLRALSGEVRLSGNGTHESPIFEVLEGASLFFYAGTHIFNGQIVTQPEGDFVIRSNFGTDSGNTQFNVTGTGLRWENGLLTSGTVTNTGTITIPATGNPGIQDGTLINAGEAVFSGGNLRLQANSEFRNNSTFTSTDNFNINSTSIDRGEFVNNGLFHQSGGEGTSFIRSDFTNEGTGEVRISSGILRYQAAFDHAEDGLITGKGALDLAQATSNLKGIISPGSPKGNLTYTGNYEPNDTSSALNILFYQTDSENPEPENNMLSVMQTDYNVGFRRIGGAATLAGELIIETETDFIPETDTEFEVIRAPDGITGGFSSYTGLVDLVNQRSYYPQVRDTSLVLVTSDVIPSLSGTIQAEPVSIQAGEEQMITFTGTGFPPDLAVELTCLECNEPELFGSITGRVASISPDTADVWFDVSNARISGTYNAVITDPRGGEATTQITINQGAIELSVHVFKESTEGQDNTGLFVIRANRTSQELISVPYSLYGSAQQYVHYTTDLLGESIPFPAGADSVVITILPLQTESEEVRVVGLQIEQTDQDIGVAFKSVNQTFASMEILTGGESNNDLRVLNFTPNRGGNVGFTTVTVVGSGFTDNTAVRLSGPDGDGVSQNVKVNETGTKLETQLRLIGQDIGVRDLIIQGDSSQEVVIPNAFTIEGGVYPDVFVQVFAPVRVPRVRNRSYKIILQNQGNVDVTGYAVLSGFPLNAEWELIDGNVKRADGTTAQWSSIVPIREENNRMIFELPAATLPAGGTRTFEIVASIPQAVNMQLKAAWIYK